MRRVLSRGVVLTLALVGCGGASSAERAELEDEDDYEQSCGGTGEEAYEGVDCAWPDHCELGELPAAPTSALPPIARVRAFPVTAPTRAPTVRLERDGSYDAMPDCVVGNAMTSVALEDGGILWVAYDILPMWEPSAECAGATHFAAAILDGEALLLPLPCAPYEDPTPATGCPAAGLDGAAREAWARALYDEAETAFQIGSYADALSGFLSLRALMPRSAAPLHNLVQSVRPLTQASCAFRDGAVARHQTLPEPPASPPPDDECNRVPPFMGCFAPRRPARRHEFCPAFAE